ncbi:hypothetical protein L9F63_006588, partial [Diploptera punctata]
LFPSLTLLYLTKILIETKLRKLNFTHKVMFISIVYLTVISNAFKWFQSILKF